MRNYFVFDGVPSTYFNAYVLNSNSADSAERDIESVSVPGRTGALTLDNYRYKNIDIETDCYIKENPAQNIPGLRSFLSVHVSYCKYMESIHPEEYRLARFTGGFQIDKSDRAGATFTLKFDADPRRFLIVGDLPAVVSNGSIIQNPTLFDSMPIIRAYGTGSITIGGRQLTVNSADGYTDLDCELQEAYKGTMNCNRYITGDYPVIPPGQNMIGITGFTNVQITPRWFKI